MRRIRYLPALLLLATPLASTHAADPNGYTAQYECRAGNPNCNVDVAALGARACDQIITASMPWSSINWSNNTICLEAGDHTWKGGLTIPSSANGSSTYYKVLRYSRAGDSNEDPWRQGGASQARLTGLTVQGSYWVVHRLTFPGLSGTGPSPRINISASGSGVNNVIVDRTLVEGAGQGSSYYGYSQNCNSSNYDRLTVQNSVFRNLGPYAPVWEAIAVDLQCGTNLRAVNNEIYDWVSHPIQIGHDGGPTLTGVVVENNDLYITPALYTSGGAKSKAESVLSVKAKGTSSSPIRVMQNRLWGARKTDLSYCCNGEDGNAVTHYDRNNYLLFQNNLIADSQIGLNNVADNNSFIGNIFHNIRAFDGSTFSGPWNAWYSHDGAGSYEMYFNTVIAATGYSFPSLEHHNVDVRCNVVLSSGPKYSGNPPGSSRADRNAFYDSPSWTFNGDGTNVVNGIKTRTGGTSYGTGEILRLGPIESCRSDSDAACYLYRVTAGGRTADGGAQYCTALGCTDQDGSVSVQAIRGPYKMYRKLRTNAEPYVIPYARVHASAPEAYGCPNDFGGRSGIGINDDT